MKTSKIADKIVKAMYRDFVETGNESSTADTFVSMFSDEPAHIVYVAIRMLSADGFLSVSYSDNEPDNLFLNVSSIHECDENTALKKGYSFVKEIRSWF